MDNTRKALERARDLARAQDEELMRLGDSLDALGLTEALDALDALVFERVEARSRWASDHNIREEKDK